MTKLDRETVLQVAKLARLKLSEDEVSYYQSQLSKVVDYFSIIDNATDSLGESWRFDIEGNGIPQREDTSVESQVVERVLESAPKTVGTAFQVPRIIE